VPRASEPLDEAGLQVRPADSGLTDPNTIVCAKTPGIR
jgi:hypothetical protein